MASFLPLISDHFPAPHSTISPSQPVICLNDQISLIFQRCSEQPSIKDQFLKILPPQCQKSFLPCFARYQSPRRSLEDHAKQVRDSIVQIDRLAEWRVHAVEEIREKTKKSQQLESLLEQFQLNNGFTPQEQWKEIDRTLGRDEESPHYHQLVKRHNDLIAQRDAFDSAVSQLELQMQLNDTRMNIAKESVDQMRLANGELTRQMNQALDEFTNALEDALVSEDEREALQVQIRTILRTE